MKKLLVASALVMAGTIAAAAQSPEDFRYYINPGHGSWTGNDRPVQTIGHAKYSSTNTDTTAFFESNTDLIKGFGVLETLIEMGVPFDRTLNQEGERWEIGAAKDLSQNIVMSRVKNGPYEANNTTSSDNYMLYNRSLPEICAEVNANDFDIFISIHSNAADLGSSTNYHLFMYRGRNGIQNVAVQGSWEMAEAASKYSFPNAHASWSANYTYINGDLDFMKYNLGVLKHDCPGYLVEGYFHTYYPSTHRGMNFDVDFEEGCAYGRGIAEYFEFDREPTGDIYGIVRDQHEKFTHALYKPRANSDDVYKPLNGVKVNLLKDGEKIAEYITDENYNGAYVFFNLEPGTYTVTYEHPDYKPVAPQEVEVVAGNCVYPKMWLENVEWIQPDDLKFNYPDELGENTAYGAADKYNFNHEYTKSISELDGKTVRRVVSKGQKLYILALDGGNNPTIVVYDTENQKVLATPSTKGMEGRILDCSDIQVTADGVLVACPQTKLHYSDDQIQEGDGGRGELSFYRWENDLEGVPTGDPIAFITTKNAALWYRTYSGNTFAYQGTLEEGSITLASPTITAPYALRTLEITVADGEGVAESIHKPQINKVNMDDNTLGEGYRFIVSPLDDSKVWLVSSKAGIIELDNKTTDQPTDMTVFSNHEELANATGATAFKYAGHAYLTVPSADDAAVTMLDVTAGLDKAVKVEVNKKGAVNAPAKAKAADNLGSELGFAGVTVVDRDKTTNAVTSAHIVLMGVNGNSVTRLSTKDTDQELMSAPYAYDLKAEKGEDCYVLTFKASQDAEKAEIILPQIQTPGEGIKVIDLGAVKAGENTYSLPKEEVIEATEWEIRLTGAAVPSAGLVYTSDVKLKNNSRGGVTWISDTDSPNFGRIITSAGYKQGITVYNPDLTKVDTYLPDGNEWVASKVNSPYRLSNTDGIAYIVDWSDAGAGYWEFDASAPETTRDVLGGTRENTGAHVLDGKNIGGGSTSVAFQGKGNEKVMYSFSEDFPAGNGTMTLTRQTIGTSNPWTQVPEPFAGISATNLMGGTNVEIVAIPDGIFVAQANSENIENKPSFVYVDNNGNIKFNSYALGDDLPSCGSGIAITSDLKTMAISEKANGIGIWDVEWTDNTPKLTKRYIIPGSAGTDEVNQLAFDNAGNLYAWHRDNYGFRTYAVKNAAPVAVTAAPSIYALLKIDGADDIIKDSDDANAPVEYYDLRGIRIDRPTAGSVVIRRQGSTVTKIVVK